VNHRFIIGDHVRIVRRGDDWAYWDPRYDELVGREVVITGKAEFVAGHVYHQVDVGNFMHRGGSYTSVYIPDHVLEFAPVPCPGHGMNNTHLLQELPP